MEGRRLQSRAFLPATNRGKEEDRSEAIAARLAIEAGISNITPIRRALGKAAGSVIGVSRC
jgi:hypothetical protein